MSSENHVDFVLLFLGLHFVIKGRAHHLALPITHLNFSFCLSHIFLCLSVSLSPDQMDDKRRAGKTEKFPLRERREERKRKRGNCKWRNFLQTGSGGGGVTACLSDSIFHIRRLTTNKKRHTKRPRHLYTTDITKKEKKSRATWAEGVYWTLEYYL